MKTVRIVETKVCFGLLLFLITIAGTVLAVPPKVIKTLPENGDENVNPNLRQIRILFDQDMNRSGYSICGDESSPKFPKITGKPRWVGRRALSVRVKLVPDHEYELSINCQSFKNFQNIEGEPAEPYPLRFKTAPAEGSDKAEMPSAIVDNAEAIKELHRAIDECYSYRDMRAIDWDKLFAEKADALRAAKTPEKFAAVAGELLGHAKDKHIWLNVGKRHFPSYKKPVTPNANFSKLKELVPKWQKRSAAVYTGQFDDGIGYILIDSWAQKRTEALEQTYVAIWEFADAPGIIIDVRGNGGGSEPLAQQFAGCFIDKSVLYAKNVYRDPDQPSGFGKPHERMLQPNKRRPKYRGKIAVLMGPVNMSSCEAFLLMMKQIPGCKLVGATSQGSSGNPKPYELGNRVTVYLPSWKAMRPDGTCFEGEGIKPDIPVETTQTELFSRDPILEAALSLLRKP